MRAIINQKSAYNDKPCMANPVLAYLKKSINPGGTPTRVKEWAGFILLVQVLVLYLNNVTKGPIDVEFVLLVTVVAQVWAFWFVKKQRHQLRMLRWLIYTGLAIQVLAVHYTDAEIAGTLFFMVWSSIALLSERRGYFTLGFGLFIFMLIFSCLTVTVYLADDQSINSSTSIATFISGISFVLINFYLLYTDFRADKLKLDTMQHQFRKLELIASSMSDILNKKEPVEKLLWHVSRRCIPLLGLEDFVIYLYDAESESLSQVAAYGDKKKDKLGIINPILIKPGQGIVGTCYLEKKPILVDDTSLFPNYIVDQKERASELAVPIFSGDEVVGVLDSESSTIGFYNQYHQQVFEVISSFCGVKITDERALSQIKEAEVAKELTERFKELDEMKNRFISNISHDLKTPLSLIKGPIQQIIRTNTDPVTLKNAGYIQKNTGHLLHMVEQLLQLQRLDHGLKHLYPERFQVCDIIRPLLEQFESLIESKNIQLEAERCELVLFTDRFKLQQCIHNLLQNAFKHTPAGGKVGVHVYREESNGDLLIEVSDTGPGISVSDSKKIFERFFKTDVNNHEGTGIGLALVKEYMDMIGGKVDYSLTPEGGSCFTLKIGKDVLEEMEHESTEAQAQGQSDNPVVLVVEDHPELNDFISSSIRQEFQVLQAFDGEKAWELCQSEVPDLVVADLMLPGMQGEELLAKIKENDALAHIPVIILSSKSKVPDKVELYGLGAENYLVKPFDSEELIAVIQNCFQRNKKLQQLLSQERAKLPEQGISTDENAEAGIVFKSIEIILEHLDNPELSGQTLCDSFGIGRNRLQRELKTATGFSPAEFIRSVRLQEAYKLLEDGRLNVSEVAYSVGFNNLSYFTRSFKTQFGILPSEVLRAEEA